MCVPEANTPSGLFTFSIFRLQLHRIPDMRLDLKSSSEQTTVHLLFIDDFFKLLAALNSDFLSIYFPISGSCLTNQDKQ